MTTAAVNQFLQKVSEDAALQSALATALESDNDREAVTQLANDQGYPFSSDELWAEIQKRQREFEARQASGELSDEELEAVAGGLTPIVSIVVSAHIVAISIGVTFDVQRNTKW